MRKIVVAITGASGSIYAENLIRKLLAVKDQWTELAVVMTTNAREVWKTELENDSWKNFPVTIYGTTDFSAPFASGSGQFHLSWWYYLPCNSIFLQPAKNH